MKRMEPIVFEYKDSAATLTEFKCPYCGAKIKFKPDQNMACYRCNHIFVSKTEEVRFTRITINDAGKYQRLDQVLTPAEYQLLAEQHAPHGCCECDDICPWCDSKLLAEWLTRIRAK